MKKIYKPDREDLHGVAELIIGKRGRERCHTGKIKLASLTPP